MDAANLSFKKIALPLAFALLIPAVAFAQPAFQLSTNSVTILGQTPGTVTVSSSTGTAITFSATITAASDNWLCINNFANSVAGLTTPTTLSLSVCGSPSIFITTHTATVTLHATDSSGAADATISVTNQNGSGGGGGTGSIVATPASVTSTVGFSGSSQAIVTLTTSSVAAIGFTLASPPVTWISWFQTSGNSGLVSSGSPAQITLNLNGAGQLQTSLAATLTITTQTGTLQIPVTLNNGVSGSGGGTGTLSVSPSSIPWSYSLSNPGTFPSSTTLSVSSTEGSVAYTATATSSNNWLLVNSGFTATGTLGVTPLTISPSGNLGALAPGTYTGTVTITEVDDNSTATVNVTATVTGTNSGLLTISPNPISLSAGTNGSTTSTSVSITSAVSGTLQATVTGTGLSISIPNQNVTANVPTTVTIFGNPAGLTNNTYVGTLNVSVAGNTAGAQINFVVGSGTTGGSTTAVAPSQLNFYYEQNTSMPSFQSQQVYLNGSGNFTVSSSTSWLSTSLSSGSLPDTFSIGANASGMASGTYSGQVTITNSSTGQSSVVNVTLQVTGITTLYASPGDWVFNYIANVSSVSQVQGITVLASDGSPVSIFASVTNASATPWLTVSGGNSTTGLSVTGNTPIGLTVTTNASNLANGVYSGSIAIVGGNNTLTIPIVLVVTGSSVSTGGSGTLTLGTTAMTLQAQVNGLPVSQTLSVGATTSTAFSVTSQGFFNGITWLNVSPSGSATAPTTLTVTANPAGLAIGNYSGTISLVANGSTQTVQVTLVVGTTGSGGGTLVVTANGGSATSPTLTFNAASVGAGVPTQYISVTSPSGQSAVSFTAAATTTSGGNWIQLGTTTGQTYTTPITALTVTANTVGLAAGTYNGQITLTPVSGGTAVSVPVVLTIGGSPTIGVSTTALTFAYQAGGAAPNTQSVPVTVSNGTSASFTASAASTPSGWLVVTPAAGTAPANLTVSIVPTGLAAGTYTGTITVSGGSNTTGSAATVAVTLTVTVPLPTITAVVNGASFVNGAISPGEIITIGGTNIGPATPVSLTLDSTGKFVTTTLGGDQVLINGIPAPLLYVSASQINAVVPYGIAGILNPTVLVETNVSSTNPTGTSSNGFVVNASATAPGIFTANGSGTGPGAILNADYSSNVANPAARGSVVQLFLTGEGQTSPAGVNGKVTPLSGPYPGPLLQLAITVGGQPANFQFAGEAPGLVSGVMQLNVVIPATLSATGNVPINVTIGSNSTQGGVTVNIK